MFYSLLVVGVWICVGSLFCDAILGALLNLAIICLRKRELVILLQLCYDCPYSALPHCVVCLSAVCDCGISWSHTCTHLLFNHVKMFKMLLMFLFSLLHS